MLSSATVRVSGAMLSSGSLATHLSLLLHQLQRLASRSHAIRCPLQVDPLTLPQMPAYQSRQAPGAVGRSDVLAAITAAQCWEEVAAVADNRRVAQCFAHRHGSRPGSTAAERAGLPRCLLSCLCQGLLPL